MATGWKRAAEILLTQGGVAALVGRRLAPRAAVLAYHNIVPTGRTAAGDVSLHVDQTVFALHLDWIAAHATVVPLDALLEASRGSRGRGLYVAITFDDAYRGTMTVGLHELVARGLPATVFVPPGLLGTEGFWWDRLAPAGTAGLDPRLRRHALNQLEGLDSRILPWALDRGLPLQELPEHARPATRAELLGAPLPGGITLGAHTWNHANLAALPIAEATTEMRRSREWLVAEASAWVDWLAYPYGLWSHEVAELASQTFQGAVRVDGGLAVRRGERTSTDDLIPRINVPRGMSLEGLALRLSGLFD